MNIKGRLIVMNFMEFFVWGAWLISMGGYMIVTLKFEGSQVGDVYATMGLASCFTPFIAGFIADRWINAERLLGICHILGAFTLFYAAQITDYESLFNVMLVNSMFYMPTIALNNSVSYAVLEQNKIDVVKYFPPIRVWGTVGFVVAMWVIDFGKWSLSPMQLYVSSAAGLVLGLYAFTLPACPPARVKKATSFLSDAAKILTRPRLVVFFIFAMFLGAALQVTNTFGEVFIHSFADDYPDSFAVRHPSILMSISQISETLFILTIPFFLQRFGIKKVMLMSIIAWVLRFGLFGIGNPGDGFILLILSMIIYGMAFDFFNISGSLFVRNETDESIVSSAQGLFMFMTNGLGAVMGGRLSGRVVDYFTVEGVRDWQSIWFVFAGYTLVLGILFPFIFKYKHNSANEITDRARVA